MNNAIGMVELNSIAVGIETCDFMVKAAQVDLLRASTICPGKYIVIVGGEVSAVQSSMRTGRANAGPALVDCLLLPNVHPQVAPAIAMTSQVRTFGAVGVLEFFSVASAVKAADVAAKAADVSLIEVRMGLAVGGKGFVTLTGQVSAVRMAVAAAAAKVELMVASTVIPRPSPALVQSLL